MNALRPATARSRVASSGLPVGLCLEGPVDSDTRVLAIGLAIESLLGPLPAPQL
jgi:indoleacetamide hydrolase